MWVVWWYTHVTVIIRKLLRTYRRGGRVLSRIENNAEHRLGGGVTIASCCNGMKKCADRINPMSPTSEESTFLLLKVLFFSGMAAITLAYSILSHRRFS